MTSLAGFSRWEDVQKGMSVCLDMILKAQKMNKVKIMLEKKKNEEKDKENENEELVGAMALKNDF